MKSTNQKILNVLLILTSLIGYLEWGGNNKSFLYEVELEILHKLVTDPLSLIHPFVLLPLAGQFILVITLFQKQPNMLLTRISIVGIGILFAFMLLVGIVGINFKVLLSTIPFLFVAFSVFYFNRKKY